MADNTEERWDVNGVSVHQFGWSVTTVGGSRYDLPPRRGTDMTIAYRPGQIHRNKKPDARPITLVMFMVGWDPATGTAPYDMRTQWNDNWDRLRRLVYQHHLSDQLFSLTRRWRLTAPQFPISRNGQDIAIAGDPGTPPSGVSRLLSAVAQADMVGTMAPTMTGRFRTDFQLDFVLPDPFFYGDTVTAELNPAEVIHVWNDGHDVAAHANVEVDLIGPLDHPRLTNYSMSPDAWVEYDGTIGAGKTVRLKIGDFTAADEQGNNKIGFIRNYGNRFWFSLLPGHNRIGFVNSQANQSGKCVVRFRPPYI